MMQTEAWTVLGQLDFCLFDVKKIFPESHWSKDEERQLEQNTRSNLQLGAQLIPVWISHLVTDLRLNEQNSTIIDCTEFCSYLLDIILCGNRLLYRSILSKFMSLLIIFLLKIHHCKTYRYLSNLVNSICLSKLFHSMKSHPTKHVQALWEKKNIYMHIPALWEKRRREGVTFGQISALSFSLVIIEQF